LLGAQAGQDLGGRRLRHVLEVPADHQPTVLALAVVQIGGGGAHGGGLGGAPAQCMDRDAGALALVTGDEAEPPVGAGRTGQQLGLRMAGDRIDRPPADLRRGLAAPPDPSPPG
jgi:hypothetical protein